MEQHDLYKKLLELKASYDSGDFEWDTYTDSSGETFDEELFVEEMLTYMDEFNPLDGITQTQADQIVRMWEKHINGEFYDPDDPE